jgi:hypothetical protein
MFFFLFQIIVKSTEHWNSTNYMTFNKKEEMHRRRINKFALLNNDWMYTYKDTITIISYSVLAPGKAAK